MIITLTANPSIDRTLQLDAELRRGQFQRATEVTDQAAGKGINVATVLRDADEPVVAVVAFADPAYLNVGIATGGVEPLVTLVRPGLRVRTNITLTEPDGTTTKINEPGPRLDADEVALATDGLVHIVRQYKAEWLVLSGSLPPGAPDDWYVQMVDAVRPTGCRTVVDASEQALSAVINALESTPVGLLKPNVDELAQALGVAASDLQAAIDRGELDAVVTGARSLHEQGVAEVLVTLGGAGAVLVTNEGAWYAEAPRIQVRSTVGAGDAAVAGYLLADRRGLGAAERVAYAVAYGSAAAATPGSGLGQPSSDDLRGVRARRLG